VQALASTLDKSEILNLQDQFDAIDVDQNGTITLEEMKNVSLSIHQPHLLTSSPSLAIIHTMKSLP